MADQDPILTPAVLENLKDIWKKGSDKNLEMGGGIYSIGAQLVVRHGDGRKSDTDLSPWRAGGGAYPKGADVTIVAEFHTHFGGPESRQPSSADVSNYYSNQIKYRAFVVTDGKRLKNEWAMVKDGFARIAKVIAADAAKDTPELAVWELIIQAAKPVFAPSRSSSRSPGPPKPGPGAGAAGNLVR